jgi:hypothetical protein
MSGLQVQNFNICENLRNLWGIFYFPQIAQIFAESVEVRRALLWNSQIFLND